MNAVESEYHFLLCCPKYTNLRELYFSTTYRSWANAHKFVSLLSSENNVAIIKLGKYLKEAFELRDQSLKFQIMLDKNSETVLIHIDNCTYFVLFKFICMYICMYVLPYLLCMLVFGQRLDADLPIKFELN